MNGITFKQHILPDFDYVDDVFLLELFEHLVPVHEVLLERSCPTQIGSELAQDTGGRSPRLWT